MEKILDKTIHNFFKVLVVLIPLVAGFELSAESFTFTVDPIILKSNIGIILVSAIYLFFMIKVIAKKRTIIYSSELTPVILFLILSFGYIFKSVNLYSAVHIFILYLSYFFIYLLSLNTYKDSENFKDILKVLIKVEFVCAVIGFLQIYFPNTVSFINQFASPSGTFGNSNFFGQFLLFLFPINIYYLLRGKHTERFFSLVNIVLTFIIVYQIGAAQLYLILFLLFIALVIHQFLFYFINKKYSFFAGKDLAIFLALIVITLLIFKQDYFKSITQGSNEVNLSSNYSLVNDISREDWSSGRFQMLVNSIDMAKDHPFGVGLGQWEIYYIFYQDRYLKDTAFDHKARSRELHNEYAEIFLSLGFFGFLLIFVAFILLTLKILPYLFKENKNTELYLFTSLSLLVFLLVAGVSKPINGYILTFLTAAFAGFLSSNCNSKKELKEYEFNGIFAYIFLVIALVNLIFVSYKYIPNLYSKYLQGKVWLTQNRTNLDNQEYLYLKSYEIEPEDPQTVFDTGLILTRNRKYKEAIPFFLKFLEMRPFETQAHHNLYLLYRDLKMEEEMRFILEDWHAIDPRDIRALLPLTKLEFLKENYDKANFYYSKLKKNFDYYKNRPKYELLHMQIVKFATAVKDFKFLEHVYSDYLNKKPTANNYAVYAVIVFNVLQDKDKALRLFQKAIEFDAEILDEIPTPIRKELGL